MAHSRQKATMCVRPCQVLAIDSFSIKNVWYNSCWLHFKSITSTNRQGVCACLYLVLKLSHSPLLGAPTCSSCVAHQSSIARNLLSTSSTALRMCMHMGRRAVNGVGYHSNQHRATQCPACSTNNAFTYISNVSFHSGSSVFLIT